MLTSTQRLVEFEGETTHDAIVALNRRIFAIDGESRIDSFSAYPVGDHIEGVALVETMPGLDAYQ